MRRTLINVSSVYILVLVALVVGYSSMSRATVFGIDPRNQVSPDSEPMLKQIGLIKNVETGDVLGTAWLSGPCQITAAYHSVFFKSRTQAGKVVTAEPSVGHKVDFYIDLADGKAAGEAGAFKKVVRARVVDFSDYMPGDISGVFEDYAHLSLDECVGERLGFLEVKNPNGQRLASNDKLVLAGFHQDRVNQTGISVEENCRAQDASRGVGGFSVDCSARPMCSGCPVMQRQENGSVVVVGMLKIADDDQVPSYTADKANWMVLSEVFAESLLNASGKKPAMHRVVAPLAKSGPLKTAAAQAIVR